MNPATVLSLHDLTLGYGGRVAVDSLCLEVAAGEVFGLLGPNGGGKSTTLAAIAGGLPPLGGEIRVAGRRPADDPLAYRRLIGLVPQELAVYEDLSVGQNVELFGRLYGLSGRRLRRKADEVLAFVCLAGQARRVVRTLSGGMQRRLNLACALLHDPALLLLDEPTVGLDIQSRDAIFASLAGLRDRGRALLFTTHHLHEAAVLCDRVGILDRGRLLAVGTVAEVTGGRRWRADGAHPQAGPPDLERVFLTLTGRDACER